MRRKRTDEKLDIYRALMLPLMTMFLLNIGLIATTWAWYTASITSGVSTITAEPKVNIAINKVGSASFETPDANGNYVLYAGSTYNVKMTAGNAQTGYLVLMDITDVEHTASLLDVFFTTAYAQEIPLKYYVTIPNESDQQTVSVSITTSDQDKTLKLQKLWIEKTGETISNPEVTTYSKITDGVIDLNPESPTSYTINLLGENDLPLKQSEVIGGISIYSENPSEDQAAVITEEDTQKTEIFIPAIDGYELISVNGETPEESYPLTKGNSNVFDAVYRKIEDKAIDDTDLNTNANETETKVDEENMEDTSTQVDTVIESTDIKSDAELDQDTDTAESTESIIVGQEVIDAETSQEIVEDVPGTPNDAVSEEEKIELFTDGTIETEQ